SAAKHSGSRKSFFSTKHGTNTPTADQQKNSSQHYTKTQPRDSHSGLFFCAIKSAAPPGGGRQRAFPASVSRTAAANRRCRPLFSVPRPLSGVAGLRFPYRGR